MHFVNIITVFIARFYTLNFSLHGRAARARPASLFPSNVARYNILILKSSMKFQQAAGLLISFNLNSPDSRRTHSNREASVRVSLPFKLRKQNRIPPRRQTHCTNTLSLTNKNTRAERSPPLLTKAQINIQESPVLTVYEPIA